MLKTIRTSLYILSTALFVFACGEDSNPVTETKNFTSIFDSNQFTDGFYPIDMQQTTDGGYVVLAESELPDTQLTGVYLLKADKYGNFVKFIKADTLNNPVGRLSKIADKYYFFCMNNTDAKLASFDETLDNFSIADVAYTNPAASAPLENGFLLLSVNTDSKQTIIAQIGVDGGTIRDKGFTFGDGDDSEKPLSEHFLKQGKQFPFDVGVVSPGVYYFNGFYDYSFSLIFTNMTSDDPIGITAGQNDDGGFSALVPLSSSKYAAARFNFGENYFLPSTTIVATSQNIPSTQLGGLTIPELISETKVKILRTTVNQKNVLIYAADTETRQIGLYFYDEATGAFIGSKYLGFSNPFTIGNLINTEDGGIAVVGTTYLAGRFARLCIFKLSKEEVASNVK
jgi:hypothetical protein